MIALSYPVITDVSRIEVTNRLNVAVKEITDSDQTDKIIRFIDERRGRWCSAPFGSKPKSEGTLNLYGESKPKRVIGFGDGFFVAEFSRGIYKLDISEREQQEFLQLLGASHAEVFSQSVALSQSQIDLNTSFS